MRGNLAPFSFSLYCYICMSGENVFPDVDISGDSGLLVIIPFLVIASRPLQPQSSHLPFIRILFSLLFCHPSPRDPPAKKDKERSILLTFAGALSNMDDFFGKLKKALFESEESMGKEPSEASRESRYMSSL